MTINTDKLGWPIAAALAGAMAMGALSGFQANTAPKFATVDIGKVFDGSTLATQNTETLQNAQKSRSAVLEFINRNRAMDPGDARKLAELSIKATPSAADTAEIARLRTAGETATQARSALMTKNPPTDADKTALTDYGTKASTNQSLLQTLQAQYEGDLQAMSGDLREKTLDRVREVVKGLAAKGGYTVVFSTASAPYAANDLTDEALKALKK